MYKFSPIFMSVACGISLSPIFDTLPLVAHQQHQATTAGAITATIHLDPNDTPHAGHPSETWFMLTQENGTPILLDNCMCQVNVLDDQNQAIAELLPLSQISVEGQSAIGTEITFPEPGSYTVILNGTSEDGSFAPFELSFPVVAIPAP
ncbi:MAG: hypothetical protein Kow00121_57610 [Elainellaceae cyanobacterium]